MFKWCNKLHRLYIFLSCEGDKIRFDANQTECDSLCCRCYGLWACALDLDIVYHKFIRMFLVSNENDVCLSMCTMYIWMILPHAAIVITTVVDIIFVAVRIVDSFFSLCLSIFPS